MELSNNALKIFRESVEFRRTYNDDVTPSTKCLQSYNALSQCVLQNKLNVLDKEGSFDLNKLSEHNAQSKNGEQSAQGLFVASTLKECTLEVCLADYTLRSS